MKKIISIFLAVFMLVGMCPTLAFAATGANVGSVNITAPESGTSKYNPFDSFNYTNKTADNSLHSGRFVEYIINAPTSGHYVLEATAKSGGKVTNRIISTYVNEILADSRDASSWSTETGGEKGVIAELDLNKGNNTVRIYVTETADFVISELYLTRAYDSAKIYFRADTAFEKGTNATVSSPHITSDHSCDHGVSYTNCSNYNASYISLGYSNTSEMDKFNSRYFSCKVNVPETGKYLLSAELGGFGINGTTIPKVNVYGAVADSTYLLSTSATDTYSSSTKDNYNLGVISLTEGENDLTFRAGQAVNGSLKFYSFTLEHVADEACTEEINSATDALKIKDILNKYSGAPVDEMKYKLNNIFFDGFVCKELLNKDFADLSAVKTAFDTAYSSPKVVLKNGDSVINAPVLGSGQTVTFDKSIAESGKAIVAIYNDGSLTQIKEGNLNSSEDLVLTLDEITSTDKMEVKVLFWNNFTNLKPLDLFLAEAES